MDDIPSISSGNVGSRFVSQAELETAKARRDEQWKAAYARYPLDHPRPAHTPVPADLRLSQQAWAGATAATCRGCVRRPESCRGTFASAVRIAIYLPHARF